MWFTYIILCLDGSYYTGISNNLAKRLQEHIDGTGGAYTRSHKPVKIVYREAFSSKSLALKREAEIKKMSKEEKTELVESVLE